MDTNKPYREEVNSYDDPCAISDVFSKIEEIMKELSYTDEGLSSLESKLSAILCENDELSVKGKQIVGGDYRTRLLETLSSLLDVTRDRNWRIDEIKSRVIL